MIDAKVIGQRLTELRSRACKTGSEVSKACGISRSALTMYERGDRIPRDEIKIRLAFYYNVKIDELFYAC